MKKGFIQVLPLVLLAAFAVVTLVIANRVQTQQQEIRSRAYVPCDPGDPGCVRGKTPTSLTTTKAPAPAPPAPQQPVQPSGGCPGAGATECRSDGRLYYCPYGGGSWINQNSCTPPGAPATNQNRPPTTPPPSTPTTTVPPACASAGGRCLTATICSEDQGYFSVKGTCPSGQVCCNSSGPGGTASVTGTAPSGGGCPYSCLAISDCTSRGVVRPGSCSVVGQVCCNLSPATVYAPTTTAAPAVPTVVAPTPTLPPQVTEFTSCAVKCGVDLNCLWNQCFNRPTPAPVANLWFDGTVCSTHVAPGLSTGPFTRKQCDDLEATARAQAQYAQQNKPKCSNAPGVCSLSGKCQVEGCGIATAVGWSDCSGVCCSTEPACVPAPVQYYIFDSSQKQCKPVSQIPVGQQWYADKGSCETNNPTPPPQRKLVYGDGCNPSGNPPYCQDCPEPGITISSGNGYRCAPSKPPTLAECIPQGGTCGYGRFAGVGSASCCAGLSCTGNVCQSVSKVPPTKLKQGDPCNPQFYEPICDLSCPNKDIRGNTITYSDGKTIRCGPAPTAPEECILNECVNGKLCIRTPDKGLHPVGAKCLTTTVPCHPDNYLFLGFGYDYCSTVCPGKPVTTDSNNGYCERTVVLGVSGKDECVKDACVNGKLCIPTDGGLKAVGPDCPPKVADGKRCVAGTNVSSNLPNCDTCQNGFFPSDAKIGVVATCGPVGSTPPPQNPGGLPDKTACWDGAAQTTTGDQKPLPFCTECANRPPSTNGQTTCGAGASAAGTTGQPTVVTPCQNKRVGDCSTNQKLCAYDPFRGIYESDRSCGAVAPVGIVPVGTTGCCANDADCTSFGAGSTCSVGNGACVSGKQCGPAVQETGGPVSPDIKKEPPKAKAGDYCGVTDYWCNANCPERTDGKSKFKRYFLYAFCNDEPQGPTAETGGEGPVCELGAADRSKECLKCNPDASGVPYSKMGTDGKLHCTYGFQSSGGTSQTYDDCVKIYGKKECDQRPGQYRNLDDCFTRGVKNNLVTAQQCNDYFAPKVSNVTQCQNTCTTRFSPTSTSDVIRQQLSTCLAACEKQGAAGGTGGGIVPQPASGTQCQDGNNNRDQGSVLLCECANGCSLKTDSSAGGGGTGWVCDQNCRVVPAGTTSSAACSQIDFIHQGGSSYCGVSQINCPASCQTGGGASSGSGQGAATTTGQSAFVAATPTPVPANPNAGACNTNPVRYTSTAEGGITWCDAFGVRCRYQNGQVVQLSQNWCEMVGIPPSTCADTDVKSTAGNPAVCTRIGPLPPNNRTIVPVNSILLQGGRGITNGAIMNDGNFQVEGYCTGKGTVRQDANTWYCGSAALWALQFDEICQKTYKNTDGSDNLGAFAIQIPVSTTNPTPAFNWRCYAFQ